MGWIVILGFGWIKVFGLVLVGFCWCLVVVEWWFKRCGGYDVKYDGIGWGGG